jgi:phage terminase large subunit GpA-like protein
VLSAKSAKAGPWETSFVPFLRDIMDSFAADCVEEMYVVKPAQTGGTESLLNMILYAALQDPGPTMLVEPTEDLATEISQERIDEMIRSCDDLKEVSDRAEDDNTKLKKTFASMTVYLGWAGSPASLAMRAIRYLLFDEVNKYPKFSGSEASPLKLGKERTETFIWSRKIIYFSTPTLETGYISKGEKGCDCRFRYHFPCPFCGHLQLPKFSQVKFGENHDPKTVEDEAWYECEKCTEKIREDYRLEMVRRGKWIDMKSGLEYGQAIEKLRPRSIGFQFGRLISPWHTWGAVASEFLKSKDKPADLMNFSNSWLGEDWVQKIYHKSTDQILAHKIDLEPLLCPAGTLGITAGVDPGQGGFWFTVYAWPPSMSVHLIHYGFLTSWDFVRQLLIENVYLDEDGKQFGIWRSGIDIGGSKYEDEDVTMTQAARQFIRSLGTNRVWGTRGDPMDGIRRMDLKPKKYDAVNPLRFPVWHMDGDSFKDLLHMRLQTKVGDPGGITLHSSTAEDFARHILAEEKRRDRAGQAFWHLVSSANHLLDCSCIALAMGDRECFGGIYVLPGVKRAAPASAPRKTEEQAERKGSGWIPERRGWLTGR